MRPANPRGVPPALPMSPRQKDRLDELMLVNLFGAELLLAWRAQTDPAGVFRAVVEIGRPAVSRHIGGVLEELMDEEGRLSEVAILLAATRWFCGLGLPSTAAELWNGRVVEARKNGRPAARRLSP